MKKILTMVIFALTMSTTVFAQNVNESPNGCVNIDFEVCTKAQAAEIIGDSLSIDEDTEGRNKLPERYSIPPNVTISKDIPNICFMAEIPAVFDYYIINEENSLLLTGTQILNNDEEKELSLDGLADGNYCLLIRIGRTYYVGYFELIVE